MPDCTILIVGFNKILGGMPPDHPSFQGFLLFVSGTLAEGEKPKVGGSEEVGNDVSTEGASASPRPQGSDPDPDGRNNVASSQAPQQVKTLQGNSASGQTLILCLPVYVINSLASC